jgi:hypothetical protein
MKSFDKWLENNREKSEDEKRGVAFFWAFSITAFIFVLWLFTVLSFGNSNVAQTQSKTPDTSFISESINQIKSIFNTN